MFFHLIFLLWRALIGIKCFICSPQKISPVIATTVSRSPTHLSDSDNLSGGSESPDTMIPKVCANCESNRQRVLELERTLAAKQLELKNTRELMRRISAIAGSLLESCTDFDKQWVSHSRKVYSQIQSVICNMEWVILLFYGWR